MPGHTALPPRPDPPARRGDVVAEWVRWVGVGRLVASAASIAVVAAGAVWLVHAPSPASEAALPRTAGTAAGSGAGAPAHTLAPPSTPAPTESAPGAAGPASGPPAGPLVVHVAGAVVVPGLHTVAPGARVGEAVDAAGGPAPDADLDGLNLAAPVADGERVYVPHAGEVDPTAVPSGPVAGPEPAHDGAVVAGPVDLNTATVSDLESLPGVGPATAQAIIDDRDRNGPFASVDDLDRVRGIGPAKLDALRDLVTV